MFKKKNRYFVLFILFLVFLVAVAFVWYHGKGRNTINEGFQQTQNAIALAKYGLIDLTLTNEKTFDSFDKVTNAPSWTIYWSPPPDSIPKALVDSVNMTYRQWQLMSKFDKEPDTFIRLDRITQIPYTLDLNTFDPQKICFKEYKIDFEGGKTKTTSGDYPIFTSTATGEALKVRRKQCAIQVTPQYLSTLPWRFQQKYLDYILKEQETVINAKTQHAHSNGRTCADKRAIANGLFPKAMRDAYDAKRKQERDAAKKQVKEDLTKAAEQSLLDIATETGNTVNQIRTDPVLRNTLRNAPAVQKLRATPYAVFSTVMNLLGVDVTKKVLEGIINVFRGGDPFAGLECPIGYEESSEISVDPTIKAISDIFPNPISDVTNIIATRGTCTKYTPGKPGEEPIVETIEKICHKTYVFPPERLVPLATPPAKCEADRDINKKLLMASDWLTSTSINDKATIFVYVIERFEYVANPNEYFVEAAFQVRGYTKNTVPKVLYDTKNKLPSARTEGPVESFSQKAKMRFYFNKNDCQYSILGYSGKSSSDRLIFFQEWDESRTTDYVPPINPLFTIYEYAVKKNIQNPIDYAIQNEKNTNIMKTITSERDALATKIQEEQKELNSLLESLNPTKDEFLKGTLESQPLEDLRERDTLVKKLNDPVYTARFWAIKDLRDRAKELDEKNEIINFLNPSKDTKYTTFYSMLGLVSLRDRKENKAKRDENIAFLNPIKDTNLQFELTKLETPDLNAKVSEKKQMDELINIMNPNKDVAITTALSELNYAQLLERYEDWKKRQPLLGYFNPNNNTTLNRTYLDKFTTAQLQERYDIITKLTTDSATVQTLNALDIESLKAKLKEAQDMKALADKKEAERKALGKAGWTKQEWLDSAGKEGGLPRDHDCIIPKRSRKKCPTEYPF